MTTEVRSRPEDVKRLADAAKKEHWPKALDRLPGTHLRYGFPCDTYGHFRFQLVAETRGDRRTIDLTQHDGLTEANINAAVFELTEWVRGKNAN